MNHKDFEAAYYINLPHRVDRKIKFEQMAKFLPVQKVIRFEAVNGAAWMHPGQVHRVPGVVAKAISDYWNWPKK
jgi:hypothetical protein